MATNILMPALSPTMTEGTLSRWLKKEGEDVRAGDVIAEIETDKATMEVEAVDEGVLGKILVQDGTEGVKVNEPIAILVEQGEAVPAGGARAKAAPEPKAEAPKQEAKAAGSAQAGAAERQWARCRWRPHLRLAFGATDGEAGRHRSRDAEGQWSERPHRQGGYRGVAAEGCARRATGRGSRRDAGGQARCADHGAAHAGAAQLDPEGDRAPADRGEVHHPAFLRLDGRGDRRADQADERAECQIAEGGTGRVSDHDQRSGDQGRGRDAAPRSRR